jgi:hypothetical protein
MRAYSRPVRTSGFCVPKYQLNLLLSDDPVLTFLEYRQPEPTPGAGPIASATTDGANACVLGGTAMTPATDDSSVAAHTPELPTAAYPSEHAPVHRPVAAEHAVHPLQGVHRGGLPDGTSPRL